MSQSQETKGLITQQKKWKQSREKKECGPRNLAVYTDNNLRRVGQKASYGLSLNVALTLNILVTQPILNTRLWYCACVQLNYYVRWRKKTYEFFQALGPETCVAPTLPIPLQNNKQINKQKETKTRHASSTRAKRSVLLSWRFRSQIFGQVKSCNCDFFSVISWSEPEQHSQSKQQRPKFFFFYLHL